MADVIVLSGNHAVEELRDSLVDSLGLTREGVDALGQMGVLFKAIIDKIESKPNDGTHVNTHAILALAKVGKYVAEDTANGLGCERERICEVTGIPE